MICGLILPRLILANFGSTYNGITASATQFMSAISILNLGVAGTTRVALYKSLAAGDRAKTSAIVRATEKYMHKIGYVLAVYVVVLMVFYPLLVETGFAWMDVALLILAAGINSFGAYYFGTTYQAFLSADQSIYISNIFLIIATVLNTIVSAVLIKLGCSIQVVKLASAGIMFLKPFLQNVYVTKKYSLDKKCEPDNTALSMRRDVMAHSIANLIHDHASIIVLTVFCDVKVVSVYTVYNLIMSALKKMQGVFTNGTEAIFGNMWVKGEIEKIRRTLGLYEYVISSFVSTVFSTSLVMILPFIALYTKGVTDVEYILPLYAALIVIAQIFFCYRAPYLTLVQGVGRYKETKKGAFAEAAINLVVSVIGVQLWGIVGVAVGTMVANLFRTVQYAVYIEKKILSRGIHHVIFMMLRSMANIGIVYLICHGFVEANAGASWLQWVLCAAGTGVVSVAVCLLTSVVLNRSDLKAAWAVGKRLLHKKRKK